MTDNWIPLKPIPDRGRHLSVNLHRGGRKIRRYIHHLVLEAFVGERPPGAICCHWDGDPANNRASNLRWDTYKSNCDDMLRHGKRRRGETGTSAKLKESAVREIRGLSSEGISTHRRFPWQETHPTSRGRTLCFPRKIREIRDHFWGEFPSQGPPRLCAFYLHIGRYYSRSDPPDSRFPGPLPTTIDLHAWSYRPQPIR
jgi:hypothetical protein